MKKFGYVVLFMFCAGMFLYELSELYIPFWASAQVLGANIVIGLMLWLFGYGVVYSWRKMRTSKAIAQGAIPANPTTSALEWEQPYGVFHLEDEHTKKNSGWDGLRVYANHYERSHCFGGPPSYDSTFEYTVSGMKVYQRLIEEEKDGLFRATDKKLEFKKIQLVTKGTVVEESIAVLEAENDIVYATPTAGCERPDERGMREKQIVWHELHDDVVRYALWATKNVDQRQTLIAESARLRDAFIAVDVAAKRLGGTRNKYGWYDNKVEALKILQSNEGLAPYGITFNVMFQQEEILKVLNDVINGKGWIK